MRPWSSGQNVEKKTSLGSKNFESKNDFAKGFSPNTFGIGLTECHGKHGK